MKGIADKALLLACITSLPRQDFSSKFFKENEVCYHDGIMSYF